ncbi:MAG: amidohydrolase [Eubacteriales bacterium]|nr:amidohydrolase [Eubacteriales bacterium]
MTAKEQLFESVSQKQEQYIQAADHIWEYAETSFREYRSSQELIGILEKEGFAVERGLAGIPTAFSGTYGHGKPVIGILGEFDALAGLSQKAGVAVREPEVEGGNGHGCGHNCLGVGALAGAVAVKDYLQAHPEVSGTVIYLGCPAEEGGSGKVFMAREGIFEGLDAALTWHPYATANVFSGSTLAVIHLEVTFHGIAAHAAATPESGRSALDGAELMNIGVQFLREHMADKARVHYAFLDAGGKAANVVQDYTKMEYSIRAPKVAQAMALCERVKKIAQGAALMTETTVEIELTSALSETIPNEVLERVLQANLEEAPFPVYTEEEYAFGAAINQSYEVQESATDLAAKLDPEWKKLLAARAAKKGWNLNDFVLPYRHWEDPICASTDVGDVSFLCPTAMFFAPTAAARIPEHSWQYVACNHTGIAHKGVIYAGQVMAGACVDLMEHPELVEQAKAEFAGRMEGQTYQCPIPADVLPDIGE